MDYRKKVEDLERRVSQLEVDKNILENILISNVPEWAKEPLEIVKKKGEIPYPFFKPNTFGSYDYYRIIALLVKHDVI